MVIMETTSADFWIDPSCPWSVMTASWLAEVQRERGVDVRWHAMSLAVLNEGNEIPEEWAQFTADSWGPVRVLAAADERFEPDRVRALVLALGRRLHADGRRDVDAVIRESVEEAGLPAELAELAWVTDLDEVVRLSHKRAMALGGDDVGSPILCRARSRGRAGRLLRAHRLAPAGGSCRCATVGRLPDDGDDSRLLRAQAHPRRGSAVRMTQRGPRLRRRLRLLHLECGAYRAMGSRSAGRGSVAAGRPDGPGADGGAVLQPRSSSSTPMVWHPGEPLSPAPFCGAVSRGATAGRVLALPWLRPVVERGYVVVAANRHRLPGATPACALHGDERRGRWTPQGGFGRSRRASAPLTTRRRVRRGRRRRAP